MKKSWRMALKVAGFYGAALVWSLLCAEMWALAGEMRIEAAGGFSGGSYRPKGFYYYVKHLFVDADDRFTIETGWFSEGSKRRAIASLGVVYGPGELRAGHVERGLFEGFVVSGGGYSPYVSDSPLDRPLGAALFLRSGRAVLSRRVEVRPRLGVGRYYKEGEGAMSGASLFYSALELGGPAGVSQVGAGFFGGVQYGEFVFLSHEPPGREGWRLSGFYSPYWGWLGRARRKSFLFRGGKGGGGNGGGALELGWLFANPLHNNPFAAGLYEDPFVLFSASFFGFGGSWASPSGGPANVEAGLGEAAVNTREGVFWGGSGGASGGASKRADFAEERELYFRIRFIPPEEQGTQNRRHELYPFGDYKRGEVSSLLHGSFGPAHLYWSYKWSGAPTEEGPGEQHWFGLIFHPSLRPSGVASGQAARYASGGSSGQAADRQAGVAPGQAPGRQAGVAAGQAPVQIARGAQGRRLRAGFYRSGGGPGQNGGQNGGQKEGAALLIVAGLTWGGAETGAYDPLDEKTIGDKGTTPIGGAASLLWMKNSRQEYYPLDPLFLPYPFGGGRLSQNSIYFSHHLIGFEASLWTGGLEAAALVWSASNRIGGSQWYAMARFLYKAHF